MTVPLRLEVRQDQHECSFTLSGAGHLSRRVAFPVAVMDCYATWQEAYLAHYDDLTNRDDLANREAPPIAPTWHRGQLVSSGSGSSPSRRDDLVEAEQALIREFHDWLWQPKLREIRTAIARASRTTINSAEPQPVDLWLVCEPIELARLPWESWEIGDDVAPVGKIRIARVPANIRAAAVADRSRSRCRILAILGDDRRLDLHIDEMAVRSLKHLAEVKFIRQQPQQSIDDLKTEILQAITDEQGWDMLFFAGHSDETDRTGGKLGIAPNAFIHIHELKHQLAIAQRQGLQFALFNSCNGLSLGEFLIDLGLNQVVVMREQIHNRVAQEFLLNFFQNLAKHLDVHQSLIATCNFLETERKLTYPSAHLLPSLFRHPDAPLFQLPPAGWRKWLAPLKPTRLEAIALALLAGASLLLPVQYGLLEQRVKTQAIYGSRQQAAPPPVLLVQIDEASINDAVGKTGAPRNPLPQAYLAQVIRRLTALQAKVIGVDYLLDVEQPATLDLAKAIQDAKKKNVQFVFAMAEDKDGNWLQSLPVLADSQSIQADAVRSQGEDYYMPLLWREDQPLPFAVWLSWLHQNCVQRSTSICTQTDSLAREKQARQSVDTTIPQLNRHPITAIAHWLNQRWLHPITDFSISPQQVYTLVSAQALLQPANLSELQHLPQQTVMIIPAYPEASILSSSELFLPPAAVEYWYRQIDLQNPRDQMTSGEHHAYLLHQFLNQRLVTPIPDLWMVLSAALAGRLTVWYLQRRGAQGRSTTPFIARSPQSWMRWRGELALLGGTIAYVLVSLELYASAAILLPIVLPTLTIWVYLLPMLLKQRRSRG